MACLHRDTRACGGRGAWPLAKPRCGKVRRNPVFRLTFDGAGDPGHVAQLRGQSPKGPKVRQLPEIGGLLSHSVLEGAPRRYEKGALGRSENETKFTGALMRPLQRAVWW